MAIIRCRMTSGGAASGTATPEDVLSGYTFSSTEGINLVGTMPNIAASNGIDVMGSCALGDSNSQLYIRFSYGGHIKTASPGYPEVSGSIATVMSAMGYKSTV